MASPKKDPQPYLRLANQNMPLATQIARRLARRYAWVGFDDLHSYAYLGLTLAAKAFDNTRGVPFDRFACTKAMFLAIDEMRKDGVLRRADVATKTAEAMAVDVDLPDPSSNRAGEMMEAREFCGKLLSQLNDEERRLLTLIYAERLTYKEISAVFNISESAICLRHKALLEKLRRQADVRRLAA